MKNLVWVLLVCGSLGLGACAAKPKKTATKKKPQVEMSADHTRSDLLKTFEADVTPTGVKILWMSDRVFAPDKLDPNQEGVDELQDLAQRIATSPYRSVRIEAYTDSSGNKAKNLKLSKGRADRVQKILAANGIDKNVITSEGYGEAKPITKNHDAESRARNRRIEIIVDWIEP